MPKNEIPRLGFVLFCFWLLLIFGGFGVVFFFAVTWFFILFFCSYLIFFLILLRSTSSNSSIRNHNFLIMLQKRNRHKLHRNFRYSDLRRYLIHVQRMKVIVYEMFRSPTIILTKHMYVIFRSPPSQHLYTRSWGRIGLCQGVTEKT